VHQRQRDREQALDRRLPMGQGEEKKPKDQKGKDW